MVSRKDNSTLSDSEVDTRNELGNDERGMKFEEDNPNRGSEADQVTEDDDDDDTANAQVTAYYYLTLDNVKVTSRSKAGGAEKATAATVLLRTMPAAE